MRSLAPYLLASLALLSLPGTASAIQLSGEHRGPDGETGGNCAFASAEVLRWTPSAGPIASYVADAYLGKADVFVALGYDSTGFWSAESDPGGDGCDDCSRLYLRHTAFDGKKLSQHLIGKGYDSDPNRDDPVARRAAIKQKIFTVAKGPLDVAALQQDFAMTLPKHDADGNIDKFTGWFAEVKKKDGALLRFGIVSTPFMCWCSSSWKAYTLAAPPKR